MFLSMKKHQKLRNFWAQFLLCLKASKRLPCAKDREKLGAVIKKQEVKEKAPSIGDARSIFPDLRGFS
jgi:hypothetical protein